MIFILIFDFHSLFNMPTVVFTMFYCTLLLAIFLNGSNLEKYRPTLKMIGDGTSRAGNTARETAGDQIHDRNSFRNVLFWI